ncbi:MULTISPECIES: hypothetical protein [Halolamina]|uniref:Uncharacterized protein n=1 Tax=Halolamina pelagica TaxID=699431 RepID=A0A1I5VNR0_9EURY|nr:MULTISPECIES: hypothetical protein [Halolamina]NHX37848.1 hypothetical protein [Halolamina sp. R1-12]SFQ08937.1 hypothetical protein SAMN05216277_1194 [Halolamina pelagica]
MSSEGVLTEDDEALLDHLEKEGDDDLTVEEVESHVKDLRGDFRELRAQFRKFRRSVDDRLDQLEEGAQQPREGDDQTPLEVYLQMDEEDREDELSTSQSIAVTMHEQWADIAWKLGGGSNYAGEENEQRTGVDTKSKANAKYNPSRLKHRLKKELGWDPASNEVYRGMKALAKISGGEEVVDASSGRVHVRGGQYEYREMATADGADTKRVLWRADQ